MENEFLYVEEIIKKGIPDSQVFIQDMTGTKDHLLITVVSDHFKGKLLIEQHQLIMNLLKQELEERIHAVKLQTLTQEKYLTLKQGKNHE